MRVFPPHGISLSDVSCTFEPRTSASETAVDPDKLGYVTIDRRWVKDEVISIEFPFEMRKVIADDRVPDNRRRMAIERGPIVYCAEWPEVDGGHALDLLVEKSAPLTTATEKNDLGAAGSCGFDMPSRDELQLMYRNLKAADIGNFDSGGRTDNVQYWASSQQTADMSAHIEFADLGRLHGDDKDFPRRVRAIRAI